MPRSSCGSSSSGRTSARRSPLSSGSSSDHVALTASTTDGCNIVARGPRAPAGRRGDHDDGRALRPARAAAPSRARVVVVPPDPERIVAAVTPRTRLLALSHVLWTTGADPAGARAPRPRPGSRSSSTAHSRSARSRSTRPGSTSTRSPGRSGSAARRERARSSSPTPSALRIARPSYFSQHGYERGRRRSSRGPAPRGSTRT